MGSRSVGALFVVVVLVACGGPGAPPEIGAEGGEATVRDCWLGEDGCEFELELDGDGRVDRAELVREACAAPPCARGVRIELATGARLRVGAGRAIAARDDDPDLEPLALDADLGFLVSIRAGKGAPPCPADALVVSGGDAAAQICVVDGDAAAYHLGF